MKKLTTLIQESEKDMLIETYAMSFEKDLNALIENYSLHPDASVESFKEELKAKLANVLKNKANNL